MRCPKCGYVSFPDLPQCKKCGYRFTSSPGQEDKRIPGSETNTEEKFLTGSAAGSHPEPLAEIKLETRGTQRADSAADWAGEVSGRVASYRRRRSNLRQDEEHNLNLQFSFDAETEPKPPASGVPAGRGIDLAFEDRASRPGGVSLESLPLSHSAEERRSGSRPNQRDAATFRLQAEPIDASLDPTDRDRTFGVSEPVCAPLSRRFPAGLVDAAVLLVAGALFAALFTLVGGKIHTVPVDLVVLVFMAGFWIFIYFALFSTLTLSTPGQSALGLALCNLDGGPPTRQEALLRAFGYLVSLASFMLGFLWAAMDSDGLAWHDHISGTMLVERNGEQ